MVDEENFTVIVNKFYLVYEGSEHLSEFGAFHH